MTTLGGNPECNCVCSTSSFELVWRPSSVLEPSNSKNFASNLNHRRVQSVCGTCESGTLSYKEIHRDKVIHICHHNLPFLYTITNWSLFQCFPQGAWHLNTVNSLFQLLHVCLIITRFLVQKNRQSSTLFFSEDALAAASRYCAVFFS